MREPMSKYKIYLEIVIGMKWNPIESRYQPHLPWKPTILMSPVVGNENLIPFSIPNGSKVLWLVSKVRDRMTLVGFPYLSKMLPW